MGEEGPFGISVSTSVTATSDKCAERGDTDSGHTVESYPESASSKVLRDRLHSLCDELQSSQLQTAISSLSQLTLEGN